MKNLIKKNNAMTLTELVVSSILIGVVIIGTLSADFAIRTWQKRIEQRTLVHLQLTQLMEQILKDGRETVGTGVCHKIGFGGSSVAPECRTYAFSFLGNDIGLGYEYKDNHSLICFRHDDISEIGYEDKICYNWSQNSTSPPRGTLTRKLASNYSSVTDTFYTSNRPLKKVICDGDVACDQNNPDINGNIIAIEIELCARPDLLKDKNALTNPEYCLSSSFLPIGLSQ